MWCSVVFLTDRWIRVLGKFSQQITEMVVSISKYQFEVGVGVSLNTPLILHIQVITNFESNTCPSPQVLRNTRNINIFKTLFDHFLFLSHHDWDHRDDNLCFVSTCQIFYSLKNPKLACVLTLLGLRPYWWGCVVQVVTHAHNRAALV